MYADTILERRSRSIVLEVRYAKFGRIWFSESKFEKQEMGGVGNLKNAGTLT